jgi:2-oxoglutarate dehydrogenase E1 component
MFHMLRRQMIRPFRRPLIVMTPKSLLRYKLATSSLDELSGGAFRPVIGDDVDAADDGAITRLVLCSGKVCVWCQEEPRNQGAWYSMRHKLEEVVGADFSVIYTGRQASSAPAVGYPALHVRQQQELVAAALGLDDTRLPVNGGS